MSNIDVRVRYQKYSGLSLTYINQIIREAEVDYYDNNNELCTIYTKTSPELIDYIHWLEDQLEKRL